MGKLLFESNLSMSIRTITWLEK